MHAKAKSSLTPRRLIFLALVVILIVVGVKKKERILAYIFPPATPTNEAQPKEVEKQPSPTVAAVEKPSDDVLKRVDELKTKINEFEKQLSDMGKQIKYLENRSPVPQKLPEAEKFPVAPVPNPEMVAMMKQNEATLKLLADATAALKAASEVKQIAPPSVSVVSSPQPQPPPQQVQQQMPPAPPARMSEPVKVVLSDGTIVDAASIGGRR